MGLIAAARNWRGRQMGFGACPGCGNTYDWRPPQIIDVAGYRMFFYCVECERTLTRTEKIRAIDESLECQNDYDAGRERIIRAAAYKHVYCAGRQTVNMHDFVTTGQ